MASHRLVFESRAPLPSPTRTIVSGHPLPLHDAPPLHRRSMALQAMSRGGVRAEKLWFNGEPSAVHRASYAGRDFVDRRRIKREAVRWAENDRVPPSGNGWRCWRRCWKLKRRSLRSRAWLEIVINGSGYGGRGVPAPDGRFVLTRGGLHLPHLRREAVNALCDD